MKRLITSLCAALFVFGCSSKTNHVGPEEVVEIVEIAPETMASVRLPLPGILPDVEVGPLSLTPISYTQINGWAEEDLIPPFEAFKRSCAVMMRKDMNEWLNENAPYAGKRSDWVRPCDAIVRIPDGNAFAARRFFEFEFRAFEVSYEGLITGYYEPIYQARRQKSYEFSAPVLAPPKRMRKRNRGGKTMYEYHNGWRYAPVPARSGIDENFSNVLAWMRPEELFFLQIQGSGRLQMDDGRQVLAAYAANNAYTYESIGRVLINQGQMKAHQASAPRISSWLRANKGARADAVMNANPRYVFFNLKAPRPMGVGPDGAQGVPLTAERSMAVDPTYHAYGAPIWVEATTAKLEGAKSTLRQLLIAQDTGGAIKGPARGDVYFGTGDEAGRKAGYMNHNAKFVLLIPRRLADRMS